ncbi:MAG TPA: rod shape-determining protein RodA [Proteobacteria bacterium]|nr:rod shape-determining protein RodA [Pseudomonadota bacterium]
MTISPGNSYRPHRIDKASDDFISLPGRRLIQQPLERNRLYDFDYATLILTCLLVGLGIMTIYSATYTPENAGWLTAFSRRQCSWFGIGLGVGTLVFVFHYNYLYHAAYPLYGLSLLLLVAVEVAGSQHMGATRWLSLGGLNLQPSELVKITVILALARYFSNRRLPPPYNLRELLPPLAIVLLPCLFILKQPDLGTALLIFLISGVVILIVGITRRTLATIMTAALICGSIGWQFLHDYQRRRVLTFLDPENDPLGSGYHIAQSKIAIGAGKFFGNGFLKGTQNTLHFLPEQHTDFIFAAYAEQWGFLGCIILLTLYLAFLFRSLNIAMEARDTFGSYLGSGIAAIFFWQITINIGMVSGLMPVVGIPLPLFSYGGTSMLTSMILIGMLLNLHFRRKG